MNSLLNQNLPSRISLSTLKFYLRLPLRKTHLFSPSKTTEFPADLTPFSSSMILQNQDSVLLKSLKSSTPI
ncbi:hypothetical protein FF2_015306 [Malus domestica]